MITEKQKQDWITALESGNYKQGKSQLQRDDTFCCLGVLCKVLDIGIRNENGSITESSDTYYLIDEMITVSIRGTLTRANDSSETNDFSEVIMLIKEIKTKEDEDNNS